MKKLSELFSKFLMVIFLTILLFGLVAWGIGDVIKSTFNTTAATVGGEPIDIQDYNRLVNDSSIRIPENLPEDVREKIQGYIKRSALQQLINRKLVENEADRIGIYLDGSEIIKNEYLSMPNFTEDNLRNYINNEGGEKYFLEKIVREKREQIMESAITSYIPYADSGYNAIFKYEKQTRNISLIEITDAQVKEQRKPAESEIQEFYEKNKNSFESEEARNFTYITIDQDSVKNDVVVDDEGNKDYSQAFNKITSEILDMLSAETSLEDISKQLGLKIVTIKQITRSDEQKITELPKVDGLMDSVFSLEEGVSSDILENEEGSLFVVVRVDSIIDKRIKALDEVRPQVEKLWVEKEKQKSLEVLAKNASEDLIEGKKTIAQVAAENNISEKEMEDVSRNDSDIPQSFLNEIFSLKEGSYTSAFKAGDNKFMIAKINKVTDQDKIDEMTKLELKVNVQEQVQQELYSQYLAYLSGKYKIKVNVETNQ